MTKPINHKPKEGASIPYFPVWTYHYRDDKGTWEATCPHGVGHEKDTHGCDGCCRGLFPIEIKKKRSYATTAHTKPTKIIVIPKMKGRIDLLKQLIFKKEIILEVPFFNMEMEPPIPTSTTKNA